jgi:hypothetical protein
VQQVDAKEFSEKFSAVLSKLDTAVASLRMLYTIEVQHLEIRELRGKLSGIANLISDATITLRRMVS